MLLWITHILSQYVHAFRVFQYLTFRTITATLTSLLITLFLCPAFIRKLQALQVGQAVRDDGPQTHLKKTGTPTMGGLMIVFSVVVSTLLWGDLSNTYLLLALVTMVAFAGIGAWDDYKKVVLKSSDGIKGRVKLGLQCLCAAVVVGYMYFQYAGGTELTLAIPFTKSLSLPLGVFFVVLAFLVIVGSSNAVNLTDGLDGLALMPVILVTGALAVFAYSAGNFNFAHYLKISYVPELSELPIFCGSILGAGLGFLWYNTYPAQIFMGDVGSLSLGATIGLLAVMVRQELLLVVMGGIFVAETVSVILQVGSFKLRGGKRIFKMAPLHHHYELKGWSEPKVIVRFWIITAILVMVSLASLKIR
jgi:phospho-N-acetylmuramoyl-pentapeptide-transferase